VSGKVTVLGDVNAQLATLAVIPGGQSKQSYLVKYICSHILVDGAALTAILAAYAGHTAKADFDSSAVEIGLSTMDLDYATVAPFVGGAQLYVLAKALIAIGLTGAPFTTALASWTASEIDAFVAKL
jgi:hypothetical protein